MSEYRKNAFASDGDARPGLRERFAAALLWWKELTMPRWAKAFLVINVVTVWGAWLMRGAGIVDATGDRVTCGGLLAGLCAWLTFLAIMAEASS